MAFSGNPRRAYSDGSCRYTFHSPRDNRGNECNYRTAAGAAEVNSDRWLLVMLCCGVLVWMYRAIPMARVDANTERNFLTRSQGDVGVMPNLRGQPGGVRLSAPHVYSRCHWFARRSAAQRTSLAGCRSYGGGSAMVALGAHHHSAFCFVSVDFRSSKYRSSSPDQTSCESSSRCNTARPGKQPVLEGRQ